MLHAPITRQIRINLVGECVYGSVCVCGGGLVVVVGVGDELFNRKASKKQRGADQPPEENHAVTNTIV